MYYTNTTSGTAQTISLTGVTELDNKSGTSMGTIWGLGFGVGGGSRVIANDGDLTFSTTPGPTNGYGGIGGIFDGASVDGDPTLVHLTELDGDAGVPAEWGLTTDTLTFPTVAVPTGYTAVYMFALNNAVSGSTWATATERFDGQSFAGLGHSFNLATLNGESDGSGVTITRSGMQTSLAGRGGFGAVFLVPGT